MPFPQLPAEQTVGPSTNRSVEPLFQPFTVNGLTLRNRIAMAPMGRHSSVNGQPSQEYTGYYARRAAGGAGLLTSEATPIPDSAAAHLMTYSEFHGDGPLSLWRRVAEEVHLAGGKFMQQLCHVGCLRKPGDLPNLDIPPVTPSGLYQPPNGARASPELVTTPASESRLADVVAAFGEAAAAAQAIGCDGVNLHAAHGFLLDQFFWAHMNRRGDEYGAGLRTRLAEEVVRECRRRVGKNFPIFLRISQWKQQDHGARLCENPAELEAFLRPLVDAGVDLFDCSTRRFWSPEFDGSELNLAGWAKKLTGLPVMTVGSVGLDRDVIGLLGAGPASLDRLMEMFERGDFDLIAVGRAHISNPDWANKVRSGRWSEIRAFETEHLANLE